MWDGLPGAGGAGSLLAGQPWDHGPHLSARFSLDEELGPSLCMEERDGLLVGELRRWHGDGRLSSPYSFAQELPDLPADELRDRLWSKAPLGQGLPHGTWLEYDEAGEPVEGRDYEYGLLVE